MVTPLCFIHRVLAVLFVLGRDRGALLQAAWTVLQINVVVGFNLLATKIEEAHRGFNLRSADHVGGQGGVHSPMLREGSLE